MADAPISDGVAAFLPFIDALLATSRGIISRTLFGTGRQIELYTRIRRIESLSPTTPKHYANNNDPTHHFFPMFQEKQVYYIGAEMNKLVA